MQLIKDPKINHPGLRVGPMSNNCCPHQKRRGRGDTGRKASWRWGRRPGLCRHEPRNAKGRRKPTEAGKAPPAETRRGGGPPGTSIRLLGSRPGRECISAVLSSPSPHQFVALGCGGPRKRVRCRCGAGGRCWRFGRGSRSPSPGRAASGSGRYTGRGNAGTLKEPVTERFRHRDKRGRGEWRLGPSCFAKGKQT